MTFSISQTQVDARSREAQHICQKCTYFSNVDIFLIYGCESGQLVTLKQSSTLKKFRGGRYSERILRGRNRTQSSWPAGQLASWLCVCVDTQLFKWRNISEMRECVEVVLKRDSESRSVTHVTLVSPCPMSCHPCQPCTPVIG